MSAIDSLDQMSSTLVAEGYMLPSRLEELTDKDLALYGKGKPQSIDALKRTSATRSATTRERAERADVKESMAMAARNGDQISEDVWARMRIDRQRSKIGESSDD